jgi:hypothetical protein
MASPRNVPSRRTFRFKITSITADIPNAMGEATEIKCRGGWGRAEQLRMSGTSKYFIGINLPTVLLICSDPAQQ